MTTRLFTKRFSPARWPRATRLATWAVVLTAGLAVAGCADDDDDDIRLVDLNPPAIPNGVYSITADEQVFLRWNPNRENDLAGYRIWVSEGSNETFEPFDVIGRFEEGVYRDNGTPGDVSDDFLQYAVGRSVTGPLYSYAVSAYDEADNESELSFDLVDLNPPDLNPPAIPNGVYSITADEQVFLRWNPNRENDLAGYRIWVNEDLSETFDELDVIAPFEDGVYFDNGTPDDVSDDFLEYADGPLVNGTYYSYAVSAYDDAGNESELSLELVIDLPRPEGSASIAYADLSTAQSGFDFSDLVGAPVAAGDPTADFVLERIGGVPYITVPTGRVRVQDYGFVGFDVLTFAPLGGYSSAGRVEAIVGHTYAFRIADQPGDFGEFDNYAKLEILEIDSGGMEIFWGYQPVDGDRELRPANDVARNDDDRSPHDSTGGAR